MTENEELHLDLGNQVVQDSNEMVEDELSLLKDRAKLMGITFSNNIGLKSLREKVAAKQLSDGADVVEELDGVSDVLSAAPAPKKITLRQYMIQTQMKLVRLRIQNLDPKKKDLPGEVLCVANEYLGTVKKYIPYGEVSDEGYHVPYCIYTEMQSRKFQDIKTYTDKKTGQVRIESRWAKEFSLEELPPLTKEELRQLASAQMAAGN
jgi:hypothetical protein